MGEVSDSVRGGGSLSVALINLFLHAGLLPSGCGTTVSPPSPLLLLRRSIASRACVLVPVPTSILWQVINHVW